ncbi:hypothetical protein ACH5RR_029028 [Cinchona calisaya]|uniref:Uncharacterized protein n=1 Tax=Cinchona calisaya TaxID=153742 RepID=A0ABD2YUY2_9GENT
MKFFCELGSCFGGAAVTPTADTATATVASRQQQEEAAGRRGYGGNSHAVGPGDLRKVKPTSRHWKPTLHMISEDNIVVHDSGKRGVVSDNQISFKVKAKSKDKPKLSYHGEDYWKSSVFWAIPAFSPTPF